MGSPHSVHKSKNKLVPSSSTNTNKKPPIDEDHSDKVVDHDLDFKSQSSSVPPTVSSFRGSGSKDEAFFDSQAWLESDCDDDFQSVNGDFTPSRGSTASSNQSATRKIPPVNKFPFMDGGGTLDVKPQPFPTEKKKRLSELFEDSFHEEFSIKQDTTGSPPHVTSAANERSTPSRYSKAKKPSTKSTPCCLPSLVTNLSFRERKNRVHSPCRDDVAV